LTTKLDSDSSDFNQNKLNEIVLWKVNRYAKFDSETIALINSINPTESKLDKKKQERFLKHCLKQKESNFQWHHHPEIRNPRIYQIIDPKSLSHYL